MRICTPEKAIKGFQITGIYPFCTTIFTDEDFAPADLYSKEKTAQAQIHLRASTSSQELVVNPDDNEMNNETDFESTATVETSFAEILSPKRSKINTEKKKGKIKKNKKQHSIIITSSPNKIKLLEKDQKKKAKERGK